MNNTGNRLRFLDCHVNLQASFSPTTVATHACPSEYFLKKGNGGGINNEGLFLTLLAVREKIVPVLFQFKVHFCENLAASFCIGISKRAASWKMANTT